MKKQRPHITVVEDEAAMSGLLKDFLHSQGFAVSCFSSAAIALKSIREGAKTDVVVSDIRMKPMTGLDLLARIKEESPAIPVLLFTAAGSPEERIQSLNLGAECYFSKPFPLTELKSSLDKVLARQSGAAIPVLPNKTPKP